MPAHRGLVHQLDTRRRDAELTGELLDLAWQGYFGPGRAAGPRP